MINNLLQPIVQFLPENNRYERIWKLAQVDFKKRYYNDKLGLFWALLNPLFKIAVYYIVFTYVLNRGQDNFVLFLFAGILIYSTFTEASNKGLSIFRTKKYLLENIQLNRIDLFISSAISVFLGFGFNLAAYFIFLLFAKIPFTIQLFYLPYLLSLVFVICISTSLLLATIQIYLKDITHLWAIVTLAGFWTSAIFFPAQKILDIAPWALYINPFIGIIENVRLVSLYSEAPNLYWLLVNTITSICLLILSLIIFKTYTHKAIELM